MFKYAILTKPGSRQINEDSVGAFFSENRCCFVLCDGLGGHGMGDTASALVKDVIGHQFSKTDDMVNFLGEAFCVAQEVLLGEQLALKAKNKMKTTAVAMVTDDNNAYIGHIGDSRLYVFNKNKVKCRTLDHSIPQMLVFSKQIKESQIRNHPDRNIVMRAMGIEWDKPMYDLMERIPLKKTQAFLLCSDGFWELIEEKDMCSILKKAESPEDWLLKMEKIVLENGVGKNMDNYSAIAVWKE